MRDISILGSTGSIGVQALEVIAANPTQFRVVALAAGGSNIPLLVEQVRTFGVKVVGIEGDGALLRDALPEEIDELGIQPLQVPAESSSVESY
jgi:1-deoxy-D-xylulose-5-phosphate reductoisomerase